MFKKMLSVAAVVSISFACSKGNNSTLNGTKLSPDEIKETEWVSAGMSSSAFLKFCYRSFEPTEAIAKTISVMMQRFNDCGEADDNYSQRKTIDLSNKGDIDVTPVASYTMMENLIVNTDFGNGGPIDFTVLWGLGEAGTLKSIEANGRNISDASSLARIPSLEKLSLMNNNIQDLRPFVKLKNLSSLNLKRNNISDISALAPMPKLSYLSLAANPIKDFSPLAKLTISRVSLADIGLTDVSGLVTILARMPNLTAVDLSRNKIEDARPLADLPLNSLDLFGNPVKKEFCPVDSKNEALNRFCKTL